MKKIRKKDGTIGENIAWNGVRSPDHQSYPKTLEIKTFIGCRGPKEHRTGKGTGTYTR